MTISGPIGIRFQADSAKLFCYPRLAELRN